MAFEWGPLSPKAVFSILKSERRINLWEGSVRSSKTISSIIRWLVFVKAAPTNGVLVMVGKTNKTLQRNILDIIAEMVAPEDYHYNRGTGEVTLFGRKIDVIGASDERAQEKIRGATIVGCYGDEVSLWPESFFTMMLSRLSVKGSKFFGTTNPDSPYHWLKADYIDRLAELDLAVFHFTLDDNKNLDPEYVANLKKEYTGLWYKRFILGLWVLADGTVYDMWNDDIHSLSIPSVLKASGKAQFDRYFVAADYGTNNPCTFGLYGYNGGALPCYLVKEYYYDSRRSGRQKTDSEYADDYQKFVAGHRAVAHYVDPSAASFIVELGKRGINVTGANNDVLNGIRWVSTLLSKKMYFIDTSCNETKKEYAGYIWDAKAQKLGIDKPTKEHDHCVDRDRYALFTHFYRKGTKMFGFNFD